MNGGGAEKLLLRYIKILQMQRQVNMSLMILNGSGVLMQKIPSNVDVCIQNRMSASEMYALNPEEFDVEIAFLESKAALAILTQTNSAQPILILPAAESKIRSKVAFSFAKKETRPKK